MTCCSPRSQSRGFSLQGGGRRRLSSAVFIAFRCTSVPWNRPRSVGSVSRDTSAVSFLIGIGDAASVSLRAVAVRDDVAVAASVRSGRRRRFPVSEHRFDAFARNLRPSAYSQRHRRRSRHELRPGLCGKPPGTGNATLGADDLLVHALVKLPSRGEIFAVSPSTARSYVLPVAPSAPGRSM